VAADDQELIGDTTVSEDAPEGVDEGVTGIDNREELIGGALPEEPSGEDAGNSASEGEKE